MIDRWYKILNYLISNEAVGINDLKELLNNSQQTIKTAINQLNFEMEGIAQIVESDNVYHIEIFDFSKFDQIIEGSIKLNSDFNSTRKRQAYIMKRLIEVDDEYLVTSDLADELGISHGTFSRDLKLIRQLIENYELEIVSIPNRGIKLEGSEFKIRLLAIYHVVDYFGFKNVTKEFCQSLLELQKQYRIGKSEGYLLLKALDFTVGRLQRGKFLDSSIPRYVNYSRKSPIYDALINLIQSEFGFKLNDYEKDFITFPLCISRTNIKVTTRDLLDNDYLLESFQRIVGTIENYYMIDIDEDNFFNEIAGHLAFLNNRLIFNYQINNIFHGEIERKYPFSYHLAKNSLKELQDLFDSNVDDTEADFLTFYYELDGSPDRRHTEKKVAVICDVGKAMFGVIRKQITKVVGEDIEILQFSESDYEKEDLENFLVIITMIPLNNIPESVPTIRLASIFNDDYLATEWKQLQINRITSKKSQIFLNRYSDRNYTEVIQRMVNELDENHLVDSGFYHRLIGRNLPILSDNGIAFPHETNFSSKKIILKIGILEDPVSYNNQKVELIFLVAIPDVIKNDENDLLDLYDFIFSIGQTPSLKEKVMSMTSVDEFNRYLNEVK